MKAAFVSSASQAVSSRRTAAFSLLEMLVGMGILSILVLALFAMFNQTQKALLANVNQSDVMESGRSVADLLSRDLLRARPAGLDTNYVYAAGGSDIQDVIPPSTNLVVLRTTEGLGGTVGDSFRDGWRRNSLLNDLYYLAEVRPGWWIGAGLFVNAEDSTQPDNGLGTLYRYEDPFPVNLRGARAGSVAGDLYQRYFNNADYRRTNSSRLLDGVVFFRATAFGPAGEPLDHTTRFQTNQFPTPPGVLIGPNSNIPFLLDATLFQGKAFPSALELELGILPTDLLDKYRALPETPPGIRARFLTNNIANVLVFRQRIAMPTKSSTLP